MDLQPRRRRLDLPVSNQINLLFFSDSSSDEESLRLRNFEHLWFQDFVPKARGLSDEQIEKIGETVWKNEFVVETAKPGALVLRKKEGLCSVCLTHLQTGDFVRKLCCGHWFHKDCIDGWLKIKANCPLDRFKL
jgi:hypothetical protein